MILFFKLSFSFIPGSNNDDNDQVPSIAGVVDVCPNCSWQEKCVCKICKYDTKSLRNIWNHILQNHDMNPSQYKDICGSMHATITHIKCSEHSISVSEHDYTDPQDNGNEVTTATNNSTNRGSSRNKVVKWSNRCFFKCGECHQQFNSFTTLIKNHIYKVHKIRKSAYVACHGKEKASTVYHKCQICGKKVDHNFEDIQNHLKTNHCQINIFEYHDMYILQQENTQQDKNLPYVHTENNSETNWRNKEVFLTDTQNIKDSMFDDWIKQKPIVRKMEICKMCNKKFILNSTFIRFHLKKDCKKNANKIMARQYFEKYIFSECSEIIHSTRLSFFENDEQDEHSMNVGDVTQNRSLQEGF